MNRVFKRPGLGVKLNLYVLFVLSIFLVSIVLLLNHNTRNLTEQVGSERINGEVNILENRLAEIEDKLLVDINFLATNVHFFQAVGRRSTGDVEEIINPANESLKLDDITVVDGDGKRLIDTAADQTDYTEEDRLLAIGLSARDAVAFSALLIETSGTHKRISIAAVAPILSQTGNRLGAILMSRRVDDTFLENLTFARSAVHLGIVHDNQLVARTGQSNADRTSVDDLLATNIVANHALISAAQPGQPVILGDLVVGDGGVPNAVAYVPILAGPEPSPVIVTILVELEEIHRFQNRTLNTTVAIFTILTLVALSVIYAAIHYTTIRPLNALRSIAHTMTSGQYNQRAPVNSQDEVGQLAAAFNEMAFAIEQRETGLKEARERAEQADRVKSMFLASMSHELRTPLNAIINLAKFVKLGMYGEINDEQKETLHKVEVSGKHLLSLINDVLDISKIEAGSLELFIEEGLDLEQIIRLAVETARGLLLDKAVVIECDIEPDLPRLTGDEQRVRQIVLNLLSNACKFTEQGTIRVQAFRQAEEVLVLVQDSGPGIALEDQGIIFEVFRQARSGVRKTEGTGLGLPISLRLTEAHGGRLWVQSTPGHGATFYVALPVQSALKPTL